MTELILILFAAGLIYYVATRVVPHGLIFKLKKEESTLNNEKVKEPTKEEKIATLDESLLDEGQKLLNKGDLEGAEKKFLAAIKNDPKSALAYHFLGMIYLRQEVYKGAIASLEQAVKLDPLNDTAFNNLGLAYFNTDNQDKAITSFEKSISLNDKIAHRFLNLALAYQKKENWDKAAIALENATKIHENKENLTLLAQNYVSLGDKKLARKAIERLLKVDPNNDWAKEQLETVNG